MDNRDSLDRSSAEGPHPMPAADGYPPYNPNGDSAGPDSFQQPQLNASGSGSHVVLQSDVHQSMSCFLATWH